MSFDRFVALASESGGLLYLMPVLLLVALTLIIERYWYLAQVSGGVARTARDLAAVHDLDASTLQSLIRRAGEQPHARLLEVPRDYTDVADPVRMGELIDEAILLQVPQIDRGIWILDTIVTLAPLLGLLGTIVGMFNAFKALGAAAGTPTQITGGIAEALVTTAAGLFIAIVGLVFFNSLNTKVRLVVHQLETIKLMMVNRLHAPRNRAAARGTERAVAQKPAYALGTGD
jgi:biopolymer transport protein ExbB